MVYPRCGRLAAPQHLQEVQPRVQPVFCVSVTGRLSAQMTAQLEPPCISHKDSPTHSWPSPILPPESTWFSPQTPNGVGMQVALFTTDDRPATAATLTNIHMFWSSPAPSSHTLVGMHAPAQAHSPHTRMRSRAIPHWLCRDLHMEGHQGSGH